MGYFPVRYDSRVAIYERKLFIRLATVLTPPINPKIVRPQQSSLSNMTRSILLPPSSMPEMRGSGKTS